MMATVVIGVDGSDAACKATRFGLGIPHARGDQVVMVSVCAPVHDLGIPDAFLDNDHGAALRERAHRIVAEAAGRARKLGVDAQTVVRTGRPADEICHLAETRGAALIVVGAHGWGPLRGLMRGSVTNAVIHLATCAVLIGPPGSREPAATAESDPTSLTEDDR